ncbi:hypothetical protein [Actinoplanes derwentensis]|uniref:Uncharacterized protein n=1 Tax=Actinoplanes derwentensis TaxID=113562 RepID=A0A1H2CP35_9ACTN|nr:hypothetical protein [Actinoplanes derwentensis]GID83913.1 hypothetical protein Ade03nite_28370 [Actinoplanes derwentensis]SDT72295.1 hypothetical protein SAMN04489716_6375 [Actinoplanes derwentensis]
MTVSLSDGRHPLVWYAWDVFGQSTMVTRYVTVDHTKPTLAVTKAPKNKAKIKVQLRAYDRAGNVRTTAARIWTR